MRHLESSNDIVERTLRPILFKLIREYQYKHFPEEYDTHREYIRQCMIPVLKEHAGEYVDTLIQTASLPKNPEFKVVSIRPEEFPESMRRDMIASVYHAMISSLDASLDTLFPKDE